MFTYRGLGLGRKQTEDPGSKPDGAIAIADAIRANGALVLTEENLVSFLEKHDPEDTLDTEKMLQDLRSGEVTSKHMQAMLQEEFGSSPEIIASGALAKLTFGGDGTYSNESTYWEEVPYEPATLEVGMTEADLSNKNLGIGGALIVGAWISHKDNGALTSLNISNNELDHKGLEAIAQALTENKTLDVIT